MPEVRRIVLLRHGEAERRAERDEARVLTPQGREEAASVARLLSSLALRAPRLYSSPYVRARETASIIASILGAQTPATLARFTPDEDPRRAAVALEAVWEPGTAVIVTHMPLIGALIGWLVEGDASRAPGVATAGGALLEGEWPGAGLMRVVRHLSP